METKTTTNVSIDFSGLLFIVFLILKLCGVITWSWWWVTAPLWGPVAFVLALGLLYAIFSTVAK